MRYFFLIGCLVTLASRCSSGLQCSHCFLNHPQQMVCDADFVFVAKVLSAQELSKWYRYEVEVSRDQVFKGLSYVEADRGLVSIYTPYDTSLCGRPNLLLDVSYLFTGDFLEGELQITYCNWVADWDDISLQQKEYLKTKEYLNHCKTCTVYGVKGGLTGDQNDNPLKYPGQVAGLWTPYNCFYNPVSSLTYGADDCETLYSFCRPTVASGGRCDWSVPAEYDRCFVDREDAWAVKTNPRPAAALTQYTAVSDCRKLDTRRAKKKCLRLVKNHLKMKHEHMEPKELLEELMDLREMWLEDNIFDDDGY